MPTVKATFTADISQFRTSLAQATTAVTAFDRTTAQVNAQLKRFGNEFSGARIQRDALTIAKAVSDIGGVTRLTDTELKKVSGTLTEAIAKWKRLGQEAPASIQTLNKAVDTMLRKTQQASAASGGLLAGLGGKVSGGLGALASGLGIGVGAGLGLGALTTLGATVSDLAGDAARLTPLAQSFDRLSGGAIQAQSSILALRVATRGLVSDADLMQAANKGALLGLQDMGIQFDEVARIATVLGRAMGQDAAKSVDDLTTALSRMSPQILDNLGIKVDLTKATEDYAASVKKSVDQLTEEEKKMAFARAAMEAARAKAQELGEVQLTVAEQSERVGVALGDIAAQALSAGNQSSTLAGVLGKLADAMDRVRGAGIGRSFRVLAGEIGEGMQSVASQFGTPFSFGTALFGLAGQGLQRLVQPGDIRAVYNPELMAVAPAGTTAAGSRGSVAPSADELRRMQQWREEIAKLTGATTIANAERLTKQLREIGIAKIPADQIDGLVKSLSEARDTAKQTGRAIADSITRSLDDLVRSDGYRAIFQGGLQNPVIGVNRDLNTDAFQRTGITGALIPDLNPFLPQGKPLANIAWLQGAVRPMEKVKQVTKDWRVELQGVAQAFAQLAQVGGRSLDGITRTMGTVMAGASAAVESIRALSGVFGGGLTNQDGSLNRRGGAAAGGLAGLASGINVGGLFMNRAAGFAAGAAGGATSGFLATAGTPAMPIATIVGGLIGGFAGMFAAAANAAARRKSKDISAAQLTAEFGGLEGLLDTVGRLGLNQQTFLERFYGEPEAFAAGVTELNEALVRERREVDALTKSLNAAAKAQGILSRADLERLLNLRPGGPGDEVRQQFLEGQTGQLVTGLTSVLQNGQLSPEAVGSIGVSLGAAFTLMKQQGLSVKQILDALGPALDAFRERAVNAGLGSTEQFDNLSRMLDTLRGPLGGIIDGALGAGQALAALTNTGMINQDMFGGLSKAISDAYFALERDGRGGVDAVMLLQGPLQNIWQLMEDFGLQVDADTQKLIDFALEAGLIGEDFRPATEQMTRAIGELIAKIDDLITRIGQIPGINIPVTYTPGQPPPPPSTRYNHDGTIDNDGDPLTPLAIGGIVTRPTRALIGEAGPEAVIPLNRLRSSRNGAVTIVSPVIVDGREVARVVNRYQGDERRLVGAA